MNNYEITVLTIDGGTHRAAITTDIALLDLFGFWPGRRPGTSVVGAIEIRRPDGTTERRDAFHDAPCPACGNPVPLTEDAVWTCPADLSEDNPWRQPSDPRITSELQDHAGVYSNCGEDFGFPCYEPVPLHAACYDHGCY